MIFRVKMPQYQIVSSDVYIGNDNDLINSLIRKVNRLLEEGWIVAGGVSTISSDGQTIGLFQAMTHDVNSETSKTNTPSATNKPSTNLLDGQN